MNNKFEQLKNELINMSKHGICLAFSGGVDSSLLLYLCKDINITAVTFKTVFQTDEEINNTIEFAKKYSIKHVILELYPLENEQIKNNPKDRCYHCKYALFSKLKDFCSANGIKYIIDGTNSDDLNTYRPGLKALKELDIYSPFAKFGITKSEIRDCAKELGLDFFNNPSAPCIATRFPYNTELEFNKIETVKQAEKILKENGFLSCRVRCHGDIARIEIPKENFEQIIKNCPRKFRDKELERNFGAAPLKGEQLYGCDEQAECCDTGLNCEIISKFKKIGFKYVTLDMEGLRSGSMDI